MGKLDFCPYDGKEINLNNLAYEIVCSSGWNWERVKAETVVGTEELDYINEEDDGRSKFNNSNGTGKQVILLAGKGKHSRNGLSLLQEYVREGKSVSEKPHEPESYEALMKQMYSVKIQFPSFMNYSDSEGDKAAFSSDGPIKLHYTECKGIVTFMDENEDPVFYALPCCPYCHNRLPAGWEKAEDFLGITLVSGPATGKTTFLYSVLNNIRRCFRSALPGGKSFSIRLANPVMEDEETDYTELFTAAERLQTSGECPPSAEQNPLKIPAFLEVIYGEDGTEKSMIIGLYDRGEQDQSKGEQLGMLFTDRLLSRMYADLYLLDPEEMKIRGVHKRKSRGNASFSHCRMLTPEEQVRLQKYYPEKHVSAAELLIQNRQTAGKSVVSHKWTEVYDQRVRYMMNAASQKHLHFMGVLAKSDLFMKEKEIAAAYPALAEGYSERFRENWSGFFERVEEAERLIRSQGLPDGMEFGRIRQDYKSGISWHCISALGCEAFEYDHLLGEYAPVHVLDPILMCMIEKMKENGWK